MPTVINPASPATMPTTYSGPADGDPATAASVNNVFQPVANGLEVARLALQGQRAMGRSYYCVNGDTVGVRALGVLYVTSGGVWRALPSAVNTSFSASAKFGGALGPNARYYVYAGVVAGVLDFLVSADAPDPSLTFRNGSTEWAFVGTLYTDENNNVVPFRCGNGFYRYLDAYYGVVSPWPTNVVDAGVGTSAKASAAIGAMLPPYADVALMLFAVGSSAGGGADGAAVYQDGNGVAKYNSSSDISLPCRTDSGVQVPHLISVRNAGGAASFSWSRTNCAFKANVLGWPGF